MLDLIWKIVYIAVVLIHIILNIILIVILRKKNSSEISTAIESTKNVLGNAFKALGINDLESAVNVVEQIKDLFKKE